MAGGRPRKLTKAQQKQVYDAFEAFINSDYDPTIVKFCAYDETAIKYSVTDDNITDWVEFSGLRKRAIKKQEAYLIEGATRNKLNAVVAIFRLKQPQHGYTDKREHTGEQKLIIETRKYDANPDN